MSLSYHLHPHFLYEDVTIADETQNAPRYNGIPKQVSRKDFNRYILPHLWHNRWSKDGSYEKFFEASVIHLHDTNQLDTTRLHGDGAIPSTCP